MIHAKFPLIVDEISTAIMEAAVARRAWIDVCASITRHFPGSYAAILSQDLVGRDFSFSVADGIDKKHLDAFTTHYCHFNPWRSFWEHAGDGAIIVSERDDPAKRYETGIFYNEWMRAVGDYDAAVGLRSKFKDERIVYLPVHFSVKQSEQYGLVIENVMDAVRRSLGNALEIASHIGITSGRLVAQSALAGVENAIAFVTDPRLKLLEANQRSVDAFAAGTPVKCRNGFVSFPVPSFAYSLRARLSKGLVNRSDKLVMAAGDDRWLVSINHLPSVLNSSPIAQCSQFLIQMHLLTPHMDNPDCKVMMEAYGLTLSEVKLCSALASGLALADGSRLNGISYEHGRQKLKSVFRKFGISSQAELISLMRLLT